MENPLSENKFNILVGLATLAASALVKKGIDKGYEKAIGSPPPKNPEAEDVSLGKVVLYAAVTAAAAVAIKVLARKLITQEWKEMDGDLPDELSS